MSNVIIDSIKDELKQGGIQIKNTMIKSMRHTIRASWSYKRGTKTHFPSLPGQPPAVDSGNLWKGIMFDVIGTGPALHIGVLDNMAPYAKWLEGMTASSTRRQTSRGEFTRPFLIPAVNKHKKDIMKKIAKRVGSGIVLDMRKAEIV
jgi:hypothetical protein